MIFLTVSDIYKQLDECLLGDVLGTKKFLLDESERYAVEVCRTYLQSRYNTEQIFEPYKIKTETETEDYFEGLKLYTASTSGSEPDIIEYINKDLEVVEYNRDYVLKDIVLSITIYDLLRKNAPSQMSQTISDKYDFSVQQLNDLSRQRITLNLPYLDTNEDKKINQTGFGFVWGQNRNSQNDY